jgi:hypothetical protein
VSILLETTRAAGYDGCARKTTTVKIQGPGGPGKPPSVDGTAGAEGVTGGEGVQETGFTEKLAGTAGATGPSGNDPIGALAAELRAGGITGQQAIDKLLDMVMSKGPAAALPETARARLRERLEAALREDPTLMARAKRLGAGDDEA